jgi:hypothetical protein
VFIFVSYKKITYFSSKQDMQDWFAQANEWYQSKQKGSVSFTLLNEIEGDDYSVICKVFADDRDVLIEVVKELFDLETDQIEKFIIEDSLATKALETQPLAQIIVYQKPILSDQSPQLNDSLKRSTQSLSRCSTKYSSLFEYLTEKHVLAFLWLLGIVACVLSVLILIFSTYVELIPIDASLTVYAIVIISTAILAIGAICYHAYQYFDHKRR